MQMNASIEIRRLNAQDGGLLRSLNGVFAEAFGDHATYLQNPPSDEYLSGLLAQEHIVVLVAVSAGQVVGGLVGYELDKFERQRREIYIYDLAVDANHRRRGIAAGLIGRLQRIAAARGAWVVFVQADYGDAPAIALYEKLGSREDVMHFDIAPIDEAKNRQ
jgi:aminoglycoside 3-N-acetyltransferase I